MITDWETFLIDYKDEFVFNVRVLKPKFTPYEQEHKFADEDIYEDYGDYKIIESIELPDKDILIGFLPISGDYDNHTYSYPTSDIEYYKLSEIRLKNITEDFYACFNTLLTREGETDG